MFTKSQGTEKTNESNRGEKSPNKQKRKGNKMAMQVFIYGTDGRINLMIDSQSNIECDRIIKSSSKDREHYSIIAEFEGIPKTIGFLIDPKFRYEKESISVSDNAKLGETIYTAQ